MSITVQHGDNAYWGPHVFLEGSGIAEEIRGAYARESAGWPPLRVTIRRAGPEEIETALRIDRLIAEAQAVSPSYSAVAAEESPDRASWQETLGAEETAYFVADDETGAVGHTTIYPDPTDTRALHLASTAVVPAARGRGIGVALTTHALAYTAEQDYPRLRTNWRVTNLAASRFWPARGFEQTHIRLARRLPDI
jgi:ribosomal protein S18 acetylase RimI-like enzyme